MAETNSSAATTPSGASGDAGSICPTCGRVVTWTDHLPPLAAGEPARCYAMPKLRVVR